MVLTLTNRYSGGRTLGGYLLIERDTGRSVFFQAGDEAATVEDEIEGTPYNLLDAILSAYF